MPEFNKNLWAPWRMEYIRSLAEEDKEQGCFLCHYWSHPDQDEANRVIWRGGASFVCMNRFPYTNGHLLIACSEHRGAMGDLSPESLFEMTTMIRDAVGLLQQVVHADGFNVGFNIGHCAGAGLPGHLHAHVVPRWTGDTNFMSVLGETRMVPDSLDVLRAELAAKASALGLGK